MAAAPRLRGGGVDPLFTVAFYAAAIVEHDHGARARAHASRNAHRRRTPRRLPGARDPRAAGGRQPARPRLARLPGDAGGRGAVEGESPPAQSRPAPSKSQNLRSRCPPACRRVVQPIEDDPISALFVAMVTRSVHSPRRPGASDRADFRTKLPRADLASPAREAKCSRHALCSFNLFRKRGRVSGHESRQAPWVSNADMRLRHWPVSRSGQRTRVDLRRGEGQHLRVTRAPPQSHGDGGP